MSTLGTTFISAKGLSKERRTEIEDFVKSLNFKKDIPVCIWFDDEVNDIFVDYRRLDYWVALNPQMELSYVEKRLIEKGVLHQSAVEHPTFKKNPAIVAFVFPKTLDDKMIEHVKRVFNIMDLKINHKSFVEKFEFNNNECCLYLNNFKDIIVYILLEKVRWHIRMADLPKELQVKIQGKKPFNLIEDNEFYVGFSPKDIEAMELNCQSKQNVFN